MTKREKSNLQRRYKRNLRALWTQATESDINAGLEWYKRARGECERAADEFGINVYQFAGVVAALSPSMPWNRNISEARKFVGARVMGVDVLAPEFKCGIYGRANKVKAHNFLTSLGTDNWINHKTLGRKQRAFHRALCDYEDSEPCIDGHMLAACERDLTLSTPNANVTKTKYDCAARAVETVARDHDIKAYQAQAILWIVWRRLKGLT